MVVIVIIAVVVRGVYTVFYRDTSIETNRSDDFVLPAAEIQIDASSGSIVAGEWQGDETEDSAQKRWGIVAVSDWRDMETIEPKTSIAVSNLDAPWALAFLPNGDMLITERFGTLQLFSNGELLSISGIPEVFAWGQWWLLDVTVHPQFSENRTLYLSYVAGTEEANALHVAKGVLNSDRLEDVEVIFVVEEKKRWTSHFGSRFAWLPDQTLIFSVGDGWNPPLTYNGALIREQAQNLSADLWKIMRVNDDGTIPADNPFVWNSGVNQELYSYGHRNVQWIAYDTVTQRLIASEHGSKGGDELNEIGAWNNYGRPAVSYATEYDVAGTPISDQQSRTWFTDPLLVWTPTIAPSAVLVYTGEQYPDWTGDIIVAAMLIRSNNSIGAYATSSAGALIRVERDDQWNTISQKRIYLWDVRVRSIAQWPDGYIYVLTDDTSPQSRPWKNGGSILKLSSW